MTPFSTRPPETKVKPLFRGVDCVSVKVDDLSEAIGFYADRLGHELLWKTQTSAGLGFPDGKAEMVLHTEDRPPGVDLLVESVADAISRFTAAGGRLKYGPIDIPVGVFAIVSDPWGNSLNILDLSKGTFRVDSEKNVIGMNRPGT